MNKITLEQVIDLMVAQGNSVLAELDGFCKTASQTSRDLLMRIVRDNAKTEYGKKYSFADIRSVEDYKAKVPFSSYDDYAGAIERMTTGETNLITVYPIRHYAVTSGSVDNPKNIPVSQETLDIYEKYAAQIAIASGYNYIEQTQNRKMNEGKRLLIAVAKEDHVEDGVSRGAISSTVYNKMKDVLPIISCVPNQLIFPTGNMNLKYLRAFYGLKERNINTMQSPFMTALVDLMHFIETNWEMLALDIEAGVIDPSITMPDEVRAELEASLAPDPERANELRAEFEKGFDTPIIPRLWPRMEYIVSIGAGGFAVYTEKMRRYSGDIPMYFSVYAASESLMAVATKMESTEYTLLPQSGFYEFIPADSDDTRTYNLDELEIGKNYEIVLTTLSGFYRYRIGDVVRVVGYQDESPKICFQYRKNQMVNIAGEKTNEASVAWTVEQFEKETGESIFDYSVYADTDTLPGRYMLFMEPSRHLDKEDHEKYREIVEQKLSIANPSLGTKIKDGTLAPTQIKFMQQETYYLYRDMMILRGVSENQLKPVRIIDTPVKEKFFFALVDDE